MAGSGQGAQDKTEPPTPKKLRDARRQGDVWQSRDVTATAAVVVFTLAALLGARPAMAWLVQRLGDAVAAATRPETTVALQLRNLLLPLAWFSVACAALAVGVAVLASALQVGGVLSFAKLKPDLNRLNPLEGLKRMVAWRTVIELLRLLIKLVALGVVLWVLGRGLLPLMARAEQVPLAGWLVLGGRQFQALLLLVCGVFGVVALADLAWQRFDYLRRLRMSKDEVMREYKDREGDPILRGRRKQLHHEIAFSDMLHQVRQASVVVVNPTHVAVALHYDPLTTPLPVVVAKGEGEVARAIREAAQEAGVPIYRDVQLARALRDGTPLNDYIPDDLLDAVAQVLRWVDRMKHQEPGDTPFTP